MFQPGRGYNFTTSNGVSTLDIDADWPLPAEPDQFQVSVFKGAESWGVQCRKGFVRFTSSRNLDAWAWGVWQAEVRKFYAFPTGSKTTGDAATVADSSLVDLGGFISINPASVEGGSDNWGVYVIGCGDSGDGFWPYLAIMADGSDADTKSNFFNGSNPQIIVRQTQTQELIDVETPTGTESLNIQAVGDFVQYNYNCQKWKMADVIWDGTTFVVTQKHLGPLALLNPVQFQGLDTANIAPYTPYYETELNAWLGAWTGYTKSASEATVQV